MSSNWGLWGLGRCSISPAVPPARTLIFLLLVCNTLCRQCFHLVNSTLLASVKFPRSHQTRPAADLPPKRRGRSRTQTGTDPVAGAALGSREDSVRPLCAISAGRGVAGRGLRARGRCVAHRLVEIPQCLFLVTNGVRMLWSEEGLSVASECRLWRAGRLLLRSYGGDGPRPGPLSLSPK